MLAHPSTPASPRGSRLTRLRHDGAASGPIPRRACARLFAGAAAAIAALSASSAEAADCRGPNGLTTCVDADNLWAHPGVGPFFALAPTLTSPAGRVSFDLVLSYFSRPIGIQVSSASMNGTTIYPIDNAVDASLLWSLGITDRLELTLAAPITLFQDGTGFSTVLGTKDALVRSAVRDFRFGSSFRIVARPRTGEDLGPALTARFEVGVPSGTLSGFATGASGVAIPSLSFDYRFRRVDLAASVGARLRKAEDLAGAVIGPQVSGNLGVAVDVVPGGALTASAEVFALYTTSKQDPSGDTHPPLVPMEWIASATTAPFLGGDVSFSFGGGGPIPTGSASAVTTPRYRLDFAIRYAPTGHDADADGVLDRDDKCPNTPEDRDGFEDSDGCPDLDNDRDGIPDTKDRCRDKAEDFDGFQDHDGCPELDDDQDGIPDGEDKCRNQPEDKDGFQDADGCPDPDNDGDGIPDDKDKCKNAAEDFDGFRDEDGCPDPDNDVDQIPDKQDKCPDLAEDYDGFEDADGCPEPDNDHDGVLDKQDLCPVTPETINGDKDEDGCPEPNARSLATFSGDRVTVENLARFQAGSDKLTPDLEKQAKMMAQVLRGQMPLESVVIEAYADRPGDASNKAIDLAGRRAAAIKAIFVAAGLPEDRITAAAGDLTAKRPANAPTIEVSARRVTTEKKR